MEYRFISKSVNDYRVKTHVSHFFPVRVRWRWEGGEGLILRNMNHQYDVHVKHIMNQCDTHMEWSFLIMNQCDTHMEWSFLHICSGHFYTYGVLILTHMEWSFLHIWSGHSYTFLMLMSSSL